MAVVNILGQLSSIGWRRRNASYVVVGLPLASFFPEYLVPTSIEAVSKNHHYGKKT